MDGECLKLDSNFLPKTLCDDMRVDDRISELPDEIIIVILSLLSFREAAATCVLSSRWSDLWKHTTNLRFEAKTNLTDTTTMGNKADWDVDKYVELVNTVLQSHKALSLKLFRIRFYVDKEGTCAVAKCLQFVLSRKVEKLNLAFLCHRQYSNEQVVLEELLRESKICPQTDHVIFFQSLKVLILKCMKVSGEDVELFLHNCPLLKKLNIHSSNLTSDVVVCGTTLKLESFDILHCCSDGKSVKLVSAPKLTLIWVDDTSGKLSIENDVPKLVDVCFIANSRDYVAAQHFASQLSCIVSQLKFIYLKLFHHKEFMANGFPQMPNLRDLIVESHGVYEHGDLLLQLTAFMWACPRLRMLELRFRGDFKDATSNMEVIMNVERCPHQHLELFELQGVSWSIGDHIVELVTYVSDNCVALQNVNIGGRSVEVQADRDC